MRLTETSSIRPDSSGKILRLFITFPWPLVLSLTRPPASLIFFATSATLSVPVKHLFDVIIDLRKDSKTYKKWIGVELSHNNYKMLYIPKGFAHGFLTLDENTEVFYQMSNEYNKEMAQGIRWDDPTFSINWPSKISIMSERDMNFEVYVDKLQ